jgi:hypothetical protein
MSTTPPRKIHFYANDVWAGSGRVSGGWWCDWSADGRRRPRVAWGCLRGRFHQAQKNPTRVCQPHRAKRARQVVQAPGSLPLKITCEIARG